MVIQEKTIAPSVKKLDCSIYKKKISENPFDLDSYNKIANCYFEKKEYAKIIKSMRTALRDNPDYENIQWIERSRP